LKRREKLRNFVSNALHPKSFWIIILVVLAILAIGGPADFYIANVIQKRIDLVIFGVVIAAILGWLGSGADLLGLLRDMYKDYRKEKMMPELIINDKIFLEKTDNEGHGEKFYDSKYYLKVINTRQGEVKNELAV
jgi:hypothetical protein